jgi:general secretion pathway protein G
MTKKRKGFTLIELLVVIAIIALLSTLAVVALNNARLKSRDARRVTDIKQVQTALELFYAENTAYPTATVTLGTASGACLDTGSGSGFVASGSCSSSAFMGLVPSDPGSGNYVYSGAANGSTYTITFSLEGQTGSLASGARTASPAGIQ